MDLLAKFRARSADAEAELIAKQAELESQALEASRLADQLASLQKSVDDSADQLVMADSQFAEFQNRAATLRARLLTLWGHVEYNGMTVLSTRAYESLNAAEMAVADYPRVREHLAAKLAEAEAAMASFVEQHA